MGIVTTMCPTTGKQVSTGAKINPLAFRMLPAARHFAFHCWLCGHDHEWSRRWAILVEDDAPELADMVPHSE
jgi:hypothetical protein